MMRKTSLITSCALLLSALIPFPTLNAPDWSVCVIDSSHNPAAGVLVREDYQNYSGEFRGHELEHTTTDTGCVQFSHKYLWAPLLVRAVAWIAAAGAFAHASFGPHSYVMAFRENQSADEVRNGLIYSWTGSPKSERSILILK
jgi:hypothetical protein